MSPYITHGVITTKEVITLFLQRYTIQQAEMLFKELLWREYFVQVHYRKRDGIFADMEDDKTGIPKAPILPRAVWEKTTSSKRVNQAILELENIWYLHNHIRMWLASYRTHYAKIHWKKLADWTYYHFLDGELGSNHLSRQWVQSTFSHKPYFMNEENLARYLPWTSDPIYRWTYEEVEKRLFDTTRKSDYQYQMDIHDSLITDISSYDIFLAEKREYTSITILTPWDWHPDKITDPTHTICILDESFFTQHPWSKKRLAFIQWYATLYWVQIYRGNIYDIIQNLALAWKNICLYDTRNPFYRQTYEQYKASPWVTLHAHSWASPAVTQWYTKKFFAFREKTVPHLYTLQRTLWK